MKDSERYFADYFLNLYGPLKNPSTKTTVDILNPKVWKYVKRSNHFTR